MTKDSKTTVRLKSIEASSSNPTPRVSRIPVIGTIASAQSASTDDSLDILSSTLQSFEISKRTKVSSSTPPTESSKNILFKMNDNSLIQPFSGAGYKPIHVKMYLKGVQLMVNKTTTDEEEKKELYPIYLDRKSTRLNSSHSQISYAVFCLKKKKKKKKKKKNSRKKNIIHQIETQTNHTSLED